MKKVKSFFSIIIVNYNGKNFLADCLSSIFKNIYQNYEVVVVDNGSSDGTVKFLKKKFGKKLKICALDKNYGPAKARNEGVKLARGKYLCFLDNDTKVDPTWIVRALECFSSDDRIGAVQCKLLRFDKRNYDYAGEYLTNLGFLTPVAKYGEQDMGQYDHIREILAAKSAGMFIRKDVFLKAGGFDEDYFIFMEETDLGWRVWLSGYKVVFCPKSIVYHHYSASKDIFDKDFNNYLVRFHGTKNYILTLTKNLSFAYWIKIIPIHVLLWFSLALYLLLTGNFRSARNMIMGIFWNLVNLKMSLTKRDLIQRERIVGDEEIFVKLCLMKNRGLLYLVKRFLKSQKEQQTPESKKK